MEAVFESYTIKKLMKEAQQKGLKKLSKLNKRELIELMMRHVEKFRHMKYQERGDRRKTNKADEAKRVQRICWHINNDTEIGKRLKRKYKQVYGGEIKHVEQKGGNSDHIDIVVTETERTRKIEEKYGKKPIGKDKTPWSRSVQRYNGPITKVTIGKYYSRQWYDVVVCDPHIRDQYCVNCEIPNFEDWYEKDAQACGDASTTYGKSLKKGYRKQHSGSSMNGKVNSPFDYRKKVNPSFVKEFNTNPSIKQTLIQETQTILDEIMKEKEGWLETTGDIDTDTFDFKWSLQITSPKILDVHASWNPGADIYFNFTAKQDGEKDDFRCVIRFGKGCGFSNLRYDIR
jgi:hypothetical protein